MIQNIPLLIPEIGSLEICSFDNPDDYITDCLLRFGNWEPNVTEKIVAILKSAHEENIEGCYIDAGAYIGYYPLIAAKLNIPCLAFEPNPEAYIMLDHNTAAARSAGLVTIKNYALGADHSVSKLVVDKANKGGAFLNPVSTEGVDTEVHRLDNQGVISPVILLKIDVEGSEAEVLAGGQKLLIENKPEFILVEISPKFSEIKTIISGIFQPLWNMGYRSFDIGLQDSGSFAEAVKTFLELGTASELETYLGNIGQTNFLFIKKGDEGENPARSLWKLGLIDRWKTEFISEMQKDMATLKAVNAEVTILNSNLNQDNKKLYIQLNEAGAKLHEMEKLLKEFQKQKG